MSGFSSGMFSVEQHQPPLGDRVNGAAGLFLAGPMHTTGVGHQHLVWGGTNSNAQTWPTANLGAWLWWWNPETFLAQGVWWRGSNTTGSVDVSLYSQDLATQYFSGGGAANSNELTLDSGIGGNQLVAPGGYWVGFSCNSNAATFDTMNAAAPRWRLAGAFQMASAYPLPAGGAVTPATYAQAFVPLFGIAGRPLIT